MGERSFRSASWVVLLWILWIGRIEVSMNCFSSQARSMSFTPGMRKGGFLRLKGCGYYFWSRGSLKYFRKFRVQLFQSDGVCSYFPPFRGRNIHQGVIVPSYWRDLWQGMALGPRV